MKYDFGECMRRLKLEINNNKSLSNSNKEVKSESTIVDNRSEKKFDSKVLSWTESDVETWLKEKNVHPIIRANISPCNGQILHQLYLMQCDIPEFFYNSIIVSKSNENVPTRDVAIFAFELKRIFQS
jgi:hypothetical protein